MKVKGVLMSDQYRLTCYFPGYRQKLLADTVTTLQTISLESILNLSNVFPASIFSHMILENGFEVLFAYIEADL